MIFTKVNPETLVVVGANGRGAWSRTGIGFEYRYALAKDPAQRIGLNAETSLHHWAVAAGCDAIQRNLVRLAHMAPVGAAERGIFGPRTEAAVRAFQAANRDAKTGKPLSVDGIFGTTDARAMFAPMIAAAEKTYGIPDRLLLGQTAHESLLDPGCVGYYIYYGDKQDYRGVDRGMSQINSKANAQVTWLHAYDPATSFQWSAQRLRSYFDRYRSANAQTTRVLWDAAVCAHNNPAAANRWAREGKAPTTAAATYVNKVREAAK